MHHALPIAAAAAVAVVVSWRLTPAAAQLARRLGLLDRPGTAAYKHQPGPVPLLGGAAVAGGVVAGLGVLVVTGAAGPPRTPALVVPALAMAAIGLADDARPRHWATRLAAAGAVAGATWALGVRAGPVSGVVGAAVTVAWVVVVTNSLNLLDNMDGLAAGTAAVAAGALGVLAALDGEPGQAGLCAITAGAAVGFLPHNWHPAAVYLGDGGAFFLGALLGVLAADVTAGERGPGWLSAVVVLGVPLFDAALVLGSRLAGGGHPFVGGRDHSSHRLVARGRRVPSAVRLLVGVSGALGVAGLLVARGGPVLGWAVVAATAAAGAGAVAALRPDGGHPGSGPSSSSAAP